MEVPKNSMDVDEKPTESAQNAAPDAAPTRPKRGRIGGRAKGTPNKSTLEKIRVAERAIALGHAPGRNKRLAIDHMDEMIDVLRNIVATLTPWDANGVELEGKQESVWFQAVSALQGFLNMRAPYQSPRLSAVQLVPAGQAQQRTTVNVTILNERGDTVFSDNPSIEDSKLIEHEPSERTEDEEAA